MMNCGRVLCILTSAGFGYAAVWQKDCMNIGARNLRQASSFNSSAVIGPVVSWEPTVVIFGSQAVPGRTPATPQARPTIFWASE